MKHSGFAFLVALLIINAALLSFLTSTNRVASNDKARSVAAGVAHWCRGEFGLANDSPPLARLLAVLPLLPLNVRCEAQAPVEGDHGMDVCEGELIHAGRFAHINPHAFNLYCLARMMGCLWWLATPWLPAAVAGAAATHAFRGYLAPPSWDRALVAGLWLGVAQLTEFVALALLVIWPLLALIHCLTRGDGASPEVAPRTRMLQAAAAIALSVWGINVGYGFAGSGTFLARLLPF